jgi:hypothetical protein
LTGDRRKSRTFSADTIARSAPGNFTRQSYTNRARTVKSHCTQSAAAAGPYHFVTKLPFSMGAQSGGSFSMNSGGPLRRVESPHPVNSTTNPFTNSNFPCTTPGFSRGTGIIFS